MNDFVLHADFRDDQGKGASRRLRHAGKVPAIIYGGGHKPRAITLDHDVLAHQMENEAFFSSILSVTVGDETQDAILKDVQRHPAKRRILHIDLQRVLADQEIKVSVPLHFINEDDCPGVKEGGGVISHLSSDVDIACLPKDLPEFIEVDVGELELDQIIKMSDLVVPEGVTLTALTDENDQPVASCHIAKEIVIEPEEEEEVVEGEEGEEGVEAAAEDGAEGSAESAGKEAKDGDAGKDPSKEQS